MVAKRVLIQIRDLRYGNGIASCIMNHYVKAVNSNYKFDFLLTRNIDSKYLDIVGENNSNIFTLPQDIGRPSLKNFNYIKNFNLEKYDIVHVNNISFNSLFLLFWSRVRKVKKIIFHAHNPMYIKTLRAIMVELPVIKISAFLATDYAACSASTAKSYFKNRKCTIVTNAIDTTKFAFSLESRNKYRKIFNMNDQVVVGVVARFEDQKNPYFIVDIVEELRNLIPEICLLWIGSGTLRKNVDEYIKYKNLQSKIVILESSDSVHHLYSAMDIFLLPSKYEGLGIVLIEAQMAGLRCFTSTSTPSEVEISNYLYKLSLNLSPKEWALKINDIKEKDDSKSLIKVKSDEFEVKTCKNTLVNLYKIVGG